MTTSVLSRSSGRRGAAWASRALLCSALLCLALTTAPASAANLLDQLGCGRPSQDASVGVPVIAENPELDVLVIGSSSTAGVGAGGPERAYPAQLLRRLEERARRAGARRAFRVTPRGVGGEKAAGALARLEQELEEVEPDLLVWQVGTNDAVVGVDLGELEAQIRSGVGLASERGVPVVLVDPQYYPKIKRPEQYEATVAMIDRIADDLGAPVVRRFQRMKSAEAIGAEALRSLLAEDQFHMSPLGHDCLARDLAEAIAPGAR